MKWQSIEQFSFSFSSTFSWTNVVAPPFLCPTLWLLSPSPSWVLWTHSHQSESVLNLFLHSWVQFSTVSCKFWWLHSWLFFSVLEFVLLICCLYLCPCIVCVVGFSTIPNTSCCTVLHCCLPFTLPNSYYDV